MKIFGLGMPELLIILGVALLIFGPKQLPKLGNALGRTVKSLREGLGSNKDLVTEVEEVEEAPKRKKKAAAAKKAEAAEAAPAAVEAAEPETAQA